MDFSVSDRAVALQEQARAFLAEHVDEAESELLAHGWSAIEGKLDDLRSKARQTGLFAPHMPTSLGGGGLSLTEQAQLSEELGRNMLGHYVCNFAAPDVGNMELLHAFGSDEQKQRWLQPLCRGELRSTFLMTEPDNAGSNPVLLSTSASRDGSDWVLNGHKWFATAADGAAFAIVMAVTEADAHPFARASMFLVPTDTPGYELIRNIPVMGHTGSGWLTHGELRLTDVRVPDSSLIGSVGQGFKLAQTRLGPGRIHHATRWVGVCRRALDMMCKRAATRELTPGKSLATRQPIQEWIAESRAEIESARLLVLQTAWKIEQGDEHREDISLVKFHVANILQRVLDRAIQVHGALGVTDDTPLAFWYSHERAARIYDGPDEVHKRVVARSMLKTYGVKLGSIGRD